MGPVTHSLKLCRSLRRMSPMYSQPRERRKVRKSRPNQIQSHCKGAGEKLTDDGSPSRTQSPQWMAAQESFLPRIGLLCSGLLFPYLREIFFLGREKPLPPSCLGAQLASLSPPISLCLLPSSLPPNPTPPCSFSSSLWGISSSGSYTGSGGSGPRRSSSQGPW